jgi:trans-aconitate 2-methyltransferase
MWDPTVYGRFGAERSRPFDDLVARIGATAPRAVVDLGCGPGDLTATLTARWPDARVSGVDSSPEMIGKARGLDSGVDFRVGDVRDWQPGPDVDVVVSNATLQWVPEHRTLLAEWARRLTPGAWLAVQVPGNFDAPSHRALRAVAATPRFAPAIGHLTRDAPVDDAAGYATLLTGLGCSVDAWETTYVHLLPDTAAGPDGSTPGADPGHRAAGPDGSTPDADSAHPVLRWMEGTALRPVRAALDDAGWRDFRAELGDRLARAYPVRHGLVSFPFRRVFVVARTPGP